MVAHTSFKKEYAIKSSVWVGHLSTNLSCGAGIRTNNLHNFKYVGRGGGRWISELIDALWPISSKRACLDFPSLARVCKLSARTNTRETVSSFYQTFESFIKRMENEFCHGSLIWKDKIVMFQKREVVSFQDSWIINTIGLFCPFTEREWSRITSKRRAILARITPLNLFQISNASVGFWSKVRFIIIRYDCLISLGRGHGARQPFLHCFF